MAHFGSPPLQVPSSCPPPSSVSLLNPIFQTVMGAVETGAEFTAVHLTHASREDFSSLLARGGNVCVCPRTEGRLGDGIPSLPESFAPTQLNLGSDCNARICSGLELALLAHTYKLTQDWRNDSLLDAFIFGAASETVIAGTSVGGLLHNFCPEAPSSVLLSSSSGFQDNRWVVVGRSRIAEP